MRRWASTCGLLTIVGVLHAAEAGDFQAVQSAAQPACAYALDEAAGGLRVSLRLAAVSGASGPPAVTLGVMAARSVRRTVAAVPDGAGFAAAFTVPWSELGGDGKAPAEIRLAARAAWPSAALKTELRRERYLARDGAAPHDDLPADPADWTLVSLAEHRQAIADRRAEIAITCTQPMDGRLSVVVEDAAGVRLRNLVSGIDATAGAQRIAWDGRDEDGNLVAPGTYRWRTLSHPALQATYLSSFANGRRGVPLPFGSNHNRFTAAAANSTEIFLAAANSEGGYAVTSFDRQGAWKRGINFPNGVPLQAAFIAVDDATVVCAHVGRAPGAPRKPKGGGKAPEAADDGQIALTQYDIASGAPIMVAKQQIVEIGRYDDQGGAPPLAGLALFDGAAVIANRSAGGLEFIDRATGKRRELVAIPEVGPLCAAGADILVVSGDQVLRLAKGKAPGTPLLRLAGHAIAGLAWDARDGSVLVTDATASQVVAFAADGRERRRYGVTGGAYAGPWQADRLRAPRGIAVADGLLWVTEDTAVAKRALAFDLASGAVSDQRFGNPPYCGSAAGMDPADPHRWIGLNALWTVDADAGEAKALPASVLHAKGHLGGSYPWAYHYRFVHRDGRTFVLGSGFIQTVSELLPDGSLRDLAALSTVGSWRYGCDWKPPESFTAALTAAGLDPEGKGTPQQKNAGQYPVLWIDANGDGICQQEEFQVETGGATIGGSRWGVVSQDLGFTIAMRRTDGAQGVMRLVPDGWTPAGAPRYPALAAALRDAVAVKGLPPGLNLLTESAEDRGGRVVFNSSPWMVASTRDGAVPWRFRNDWSGVHGSHNAPLPETGVMQGTLFFLGCERLDDQGDVVVLNGNHGRFFVMTTDGMYVDELFRDVRMGGARDDQLIGGECFGGSFTHGADGRWYLQTGGDGYRIYELKGLDRAVRAAGTLTVTAEQLSAAERRSARAAAATAAPKVMTAGPHAAGKVDGELKDWPAEPTAAWDRQGRFKASAWLGWDERMLHLAFSVQDPSPWVNTGADWQQLFKTGDGVDLQLGCDAAANPERTQPVPGDIRLFIAPSAAGDTVVLYRHRLKPGDKGQQVVFTSPWRSETVADVVKVEGAQVKVQKGGGGYRLEAAVPLAAIGWSPKPGASYRADLGVIFGDEAGTVDLLRSYWSNQATGLVNDVPGEIMLDPERWGTLQAKGAP